MDRRQALLSFLNSTLQTAGAVVLASSALPAAAQEEPAAPVEGDLKKRADQVACPPEPGNAGEEFTSFVNGGFRNGGGGGGGFRKGGFANGGGGGGGFRKGGFANGGFGNGGGGGGGFRKGGFANGGFRN